MIQFAVPLNVERRMIFLLACSAPIEAPEDLNEPLSYVFLHTMDEEDAELRAGLHNMALFAQENEESKEGLLSTNFRKKPLTPHSKILSKIQISMVAVQ